MKLFRGVLPAPRVWCSAGGTVLYLGGCCQQATWTVSMTALRALAGGSTRIASASPA